MEEYFVKINNHEIRGMSLFIAIDSLKQEYICKLIDLCSLKPIAFDDVKGMGRDEGLITGLQSIKRILGDISEKGKNFQT